MPNWCACNYAVRGDRKELENLVNVLNTMENNQNGFGRFWMGNLLIAMGMDYDAVLHSPIHCRGVFSPNPNEQASLLCPEIDDDAEFSVDDDGVFRFSTVSAWDRSSTMEDFLKTKYPSLEFFFFETDEFGNCHNVHDPEDIGKFDHFHFDSNGFDSPYYQKSEYEEFLADMRNECPGLDIPDDREYLASDKFMEEFIRWRDDDESREDYSFYVAKEI